MSQGSTFIWQQILRPYKNSLNTATNIFTPSSMVQNFVLSVLPGLEIKYNKFELELNF